MTTAVAAATPDISRVVARWRNKQGSLIMALHEIQNLFGHVPRSVSMQLAREMRVPVARIYEVLTFYNYFRLEPPGRHVISVCLGTACYLKGSKGLLDGLERELGVKDGNTTVDRNFHLQSVRCVGACGLAPVAVVDGHTMGKATCGQECEIIGRCLKQEV